MKKNIIIICTALIILSLIGFSFINWNDSETEKLETASNDILPIGQLVTVKMENKKKVFDDFIYDVGPRFNAMKKGDLDNMRSYSDFIGDEHAQRIVSYKFVEVIIIENDKESDIRKSGSSNVLNPAQLELLQSSDYDTNLKIRANYK